MVPRAIEKFAKTSTKIICVAEKIAELLRSLLSRGLHVGDEPLKIPSEQLIWCVVRGAIDCNEED